jgi:cell division protein FtsX
MVDPAVITPVSGAGYLYLLLVLLMFLIVCVIGWFGAELTFPIEHE